jgi:hypothetical protein
LLACNEGTKFIFIDCFCRNLNIMSIISLRYGLISEFPTYLQQNLIRKNTHLTKVFKSAFLKFSVGMFRILRRRVIEELQPFID